LNARINVAISVIKKMCLIDSFTILTYTVSFWNIVQVRQYAKVNWNKKKKKNECCDGGVNGKMQICLNGVCNRIALALEQEFV